MSHLSTYESLLADYARELCLGLRHSEPHAVELIELALLAAFETGRTAGIAEAQRVAAERETTSALPVSGERFVRVHGRDYRVLAAHASEAAANEHMLRDPKLAVIAAVDGEVLLASVHDRGRKSR